MLQNLVVTTPQELQTLITDAVNVAVQQISFPQKLEPPLPDYFTIDELSKYLKLAKPTIYSKVNNRTIPYIKRGKRLYFSRKSIIEYLEEGNNITKNFKLKNNFNKKY
jgi:excisionase family DNA binding protein